MKSSCYLQRPQCQISIIFLLWSFIFNFLNAKSPSFLSFDLIILVFRCTTCNNELFAPMDGDELTLQTHRETNHLKCEDCNRFYTHRRRQDHDLLYHSHGSKSVFENICKSSKSCKAQKQGAQRISVTIFSCVNDE